MKCANCGAELKLGCVYCSVCGHEAQIVPDYNVLEDDYLKNLMDEEDKAQKQREAEAERRRQEERNRRKRQRQEQKRKKKIMVSCGIGAAALVIILIVVLTVVGNSRKNSFDYQYEKGMSYAEEGNYTKALDYFKAASSIDPDNADVLLELAKIYQRREENSPLEATLLQILTLKPASREAHDMLISLYEEQKKYEEIMDLYEKLPDNTLTDLFADYMVELPELSVEGGEYSDDVTVELSAPDGYVIYYTLDGTSPVERGKRYEEPIELDEAKDYTLKAVSKDERGIYSEIVTAEYEIDYEAPDSATVSPAAGTYTEAQPVTINVPEGCRAYYTWDGSTPNQTSDVYSAPLEMPEGNHVLSILVVDDHDLASPVVRYNYFYQP